MIVIALYVSSIYHLVWPTRLIYLATGEVHCDGFGLAVLNPSDRKGHDTYCIIAINGKMLGFIHIDWIYFVYIMSSCLRRYSISCKLNTLDACWIAVDGWSNSSRHQ